MELMMLMVKEIDEGNGELNKKKRRKWSGQGWGRRRELAGAGKSAGDGLGNGRL